MAAHDAVDADVFLKRFVELPPDEAIVYAIAVRGLLAEPGRGGLTADPRRIAAALRLEPEDVVRIHERLREKGMLSVITFLDVSLSSNGGWRGPE